MRSGWLKLILLNNQRIRFGLTLPFLIGALREPRGAGALAETERSELTNLLESMRDDTPESHVIRIGECDRLHQPVAAPIPGMFKPGVGFVAIPPPHGGRVSLYVAEQYLLGAPPTIDALSNSLWNLSEAAITQRRFSYREGVFHPFNDQDLRFINDALAMADEEEA